MKLINTDIIFLSEYQSRKKRIDCQCKVCGHKWSPTGDTLLGGNGCPKCAHKNLKQHQPQSHKTFLEKFDKNGNKNVEILGEYKNSSTKIHCRCKKCGNEWNVIPSTLLNGRGCAKCGVTNAQEKTRKTHEKFLEEFEILGNKNLEIIGTYVNSNTKIKVRCTNCNKEYYSSPIHLLEGKGCMDCYRKNCVGENHPKWNINKTQLEREQERNYLEYSEFVKNTMKRDNYTCQLTNQVGYSLEVHHLDGYNWCKDKRTDINNGITLTKEIHKEFHSIYGYGHNTVEQFISFVEQLHLQNRITDITYQTLLNKLK